MNRGDLTKIIEAGVAAPSGDNSQPWRFTAHDNSLEIFNIPNRDNPYYNFRQRGSFVAHGAVIENITISSRSLGYAPEIKLFPTGDLINGPVARINFHETKAEKDPLYEFITERATNRKPYDSKRSLSEKQRTDFLNATGNDTNIEFIFTESQKDKSIIGQAVSVNEIVALETEGLHKVFFEDMVWSQKEEEQKKSGLFIKTLELPLPIQLLFRGLRHWPFNNFLNKIGFAKIAAMGNAKIYASGSALGIITVTNQDAESFVNAGRLMQRIWLKATSMGLSVQPIAGMLFLAQRIKEGDAGQLAENHKLLISSAYTKIENIFGIKNKTIAMLLRIGHASKPSARSSRKLPEINWSRTN